MGNSRPSGGYVKGEISFLSQIKLYLHVGSKYYSDARYPSYGGGSPGQYSGGGSSDIRLNSGEFNDFEGLKSRIIVAAGGGSGDSDGRKSDSGGCAGGLIGYDSQYGYGLGANQTSGGKGKGLHGRFGFGAGNGTRVISNGLDGNAGGGGGYFGGGNSDYISAYGGGGGSSFISGYKGCIAVLKNSSENKIEFSQADDPSIHYSGIQFYNTIMIDGMHEMPNPNGGTEIGHYADGFIRITRIIFKCQSCKFIYSFSYFPFLISFIFISWNFILIDIIHAYSFCICCANILGTSIHDQLILII